MAHAIRIRCSDGNVPDQAEVESIKDGFDVVLPEQKTAFRFIEGDEFRSEHWRCLYRFDDDESLPEIEETFSEELFAGIKWYLIESHDCTHDRDGGPCDGWTLERQRGNVPEEFL